ncbi:flagellar motor protein MotB [Dongshaea marina]|uniref:flagellar motor protein MotB n=1 Tax=Dongshaea marina TaxID=2047966 RepID=UPI000D3EA9CC|nr:flagellar motor protein MotB [Dongshaea marina]
MSDEQEECKCPPPGAPGWMSTFADLMSLLMCFFVLLLAFSEMDVLKFKQIAGSMRNAFGVQSVIEVKDIPKGTSVIAQEFRPGRPEPTPIDTVMQQTIDITEATLDFQEGESDRASGQKKEAGKQTGGKTPSRSVQQLARAVASKMEKQIKEGSIEIEALGQQIVIRVREKGAFPSGSAFLQPKFRPIIRKVASLLKDVPGIITISGNTDNRRVDSELYSSNWDLSSQRAVAVAHEMLKVRGFQEDRLIVRGMADTAPLVPHNTESNRRRNRRVEISIMQGKPKYSAPIEASSQP